MQSMPASINHKTRQLITIFLLIVLILILAAYIYYGMYYARQATIGMTPVTETTITTNNPDYTSLEARQKALVAIATSGDEVGEEVRIKTLENLQNFNGSNGSDPESVIQETTATPYVDRQVVLEQLLQEYDSIDN